MPRHIYSTVALIVNSTLFYLPSQLNPLGGWMWESNPDPVATLMHNAVHGDMPHSPIFFIRREVVLGKTDDIK